MWNSGEDVLKLIKSSQGKFSGLLYTSVWLCSAFFSLFCTEHTPPVLLLSVTYLQKVSVISQTDRWTYRKSLRNLSYLFWRKIFLFVKIIVWLFSSIIYRGSRGRPELATIHQPAILVPVLGTLLVVGSVSASRAIYCYQQPAT